MFDLVHKHKHVAQGILALITLPFAFFGVDYYFDRGDSVQTVATVGGDKISQAEFDDALREQQQRMRQALGGNFDPAMLDSPEVRYALVDQLVNQRLLETARARRPVPRQRHAARSSSSPGCRRSRKTASSRRTSIEQVLAAQGMSPLTFEQRVRGELVLSPLQDPIVNGSAAGADDSSYCWVQQCELSSHLRDLGGFSCLSEVVSTIHKQSHPFQFPLSSSRPCV